MLKRERLYSTGGRPLSATGGPVGLGQNKGDVMAGRPQTREGGGGEGRCSGKD